MNQRPSLREALARADVAELDDAADTIGRAAGQAIAVALAEVEEHPPAVVERHRPDEDERLRLYDESLKDTDEMVRRHRERLGRRVCSTHDASVIRRVHQLLRSMAGPDGADNDPSFQ